MCEGEVVEVSCNSEALECRPGFEQPAPSAAEISLCAGLCSAARAKLGGMPGVI